ncbi:helicase-associated domain-containing protein, partial [Aquipuribacter hungaricus]
GLALRGGRTHAVPATREPEVGGLPVRPGTADHSAAGSATEAVRLVGEMLGVAGRTTLTARRTGGLGVRELHRVAVALGVDDGVGALVLQTAHAAGLLDTDAEESPSWVPTLAADTWAEEPVEVRWAGLALAWLEGDTVASLVGTRDRGGTVRGALSDEVRRPSSAALRRDVLTELAQAPEDRAPRLEEVLARLDHRSPRRASPGRDDLVARLLDEAAWVGLTGQGVLAGPARALLDGDAPGAARLLGALLPEPVDHLLLQADLTAVAPGPLVPSLAAEVDLAAEVESRGAATVYRFTPESVRRALDAGRTADELLAVLEEASPNGVPQPLAYLVRDVARRHGMVRVGAASSFLRSEDPAALAELLVDRRLATLGLRRLAPTVLAAQADGPVVLDALRRVGLAPAAEATDGTLLVQARTARRAA